MRLLQLDWERLLNAYYEEENVGAENCLNKISSEYKEVFESKMCTLKGLKVKLTVNHDCKPKLGKPGQSPAKISTPDQRCFHFVDHR